MSERGRLGLQEVTAGLGAPPEVVAFAHTPGTKVVFGAGVASSAGACCRELGGTRVLLVTDPGVVSAGHAATVEGSLRAAGLEVTVFDAVHENPTTADVAACTGAARDARVDILVAVGGGSSMDTAKGCNFILTNGGEMRDYWGVGKATAPMLPFVAAPTTAGTGSECQSFALIADAKTHQKMACGDRRSAARVALLDPLLTVTQPRAVAAHTGIDAVTHAVETAVTKRRNSVSAAYSRLAFALLERSFERVLGEPGNLAARADMQLGAAYAGTAIENSMLGAAHALANPLTAKFDIVHGAAVGVMLPHVVRFNALDPATAAAYRDLWGRPGGVDALAARLDELLRAAGMGHVLEVFGVTRADLPGLAEQATEQWTAQFNPVPVDATSLEALYRAALVGS
jgi:alcohol dehydrogenase